MATPIVILLVLSAAAVGLCIGFLFGHHAAHERADRRGQAVRRYREALHDEHDEHDEIERTRGGLDHSLGVRFNR